MIIQIVKTHDKAKVPQQGTAEAAGADLFAVEEMVIYPNEVKLVKLGFKAAIPKGYAGFVCSRSGLALKQKVFVLNAPGIIDSDYRGEFGVILMNLGEDVLRIAVGDRVAQMLVVKHEQFQMECVKALDETARGEGGFGSTGVSS